MILQKYSCKNCNSNFYFEQNSEFDNFEKYLNCPCCHYFYGVNKVLGEVIK